MLDVAFLVSSEEKRKRNVSCSIVFSLKKRYWQEYTILLMQIFVLPSPMWGQKTANLVN